MQQWNSLTSMQAIIRKVGCIVSIIIIPTNIQKTYLPEFKIKNISKHQLISSFRHIYIRIHNINACTCKTVAQILFVINAHFERLFYLFPTISCFCIEQRIDMSRFDGGLLKTPIYWLSPSIISKHMVYRRTIYQNEGWILNCTVTSKLFMFYSGNNLSD